MSTPAVFLLYEFFVFLLVHVLFALLLFEFGILFHDTPDTVGHLCRHSHEARQGRDELVDEREDSIMNVEEDEVKSKKKKKKKKKKERKKYYPTQVRYLKWYLDCILFTDKKNNKNKQKQSYLGIVTINKCNLMHSLEMK